MLRRQSSLTEERRQLLDAVSALTGRSIPALVSEAVGAIYGLHRCVEYNVHAPSWTAQTWRMQP